MLQVRCLKYLIELFKTNKADKLLARVEDQFSKLRAKHSLGEAALDLEEEEDSQEDGQGEDGEDEDDEIVMSDLTESGKCHRATHNIKKNLRVHKF